MLYLGGFIVGKKKSVIVTFLFALMFIVLVMPEISAAAWAVDDFNPNVNSDVISIATQTDGKIVFGGWFTTVSEVTRNRIARVSAGGSLEDGFNPDAPGWVGSTIAQADGKIFIAGAFTTIGGTTRNRMARINADGSLDDSFNPNANDRVFCSALQADGKIVVGGYFTTIGGTSISRMARINTNGSLDGTFSPPSINGYVDSIAIQEDGKIIIGGRFTSIGGTSRNRIARLESNGNLDTGFDPNADGTDSNLTVQTIAIQADGKIVIGGIFNTIGGTPRNYIARINTNGSPDTTFDAHFDSDSNGHTCSIALQTDGKILVTGAINSINGTEVTGFARLNTDGSLDTTFLPDPDRLSVCRHHTGRWQGNHWGVLYRTQLGNDKMENRPLHQYRCGRAGTHRDFILYCRVDAGSDKSRSVESYV